jgi:hypothetical protein
MAKIELVIFFHKIYQFHSKLKWGKCGKLGKRGTLKIEVGKIFPGVPTGKTYF